MRGSRLANNASQEAKYRKAILTLVHQMTDETKNQVIKLFKSGTAKEFAAQQEEVAAMDESITSKAKKTMNSLLDKFTKLFNEKAKPLANKMVNGAKQTSEKSLRRSMQTLTGLTIKTSLIPEGMEDVTRAAIEENVSLIKSIPQQYFTKVTGSVMRSITSGIPLDTLTDQVQKYNGETERRAKNLALDQVRKAYNTINKQRMQAVGVKKFEWVHSGGGQKPRKSHLAMNGNIYSFDNLPVINKEQVDAGYEAPIHGIPGQAINCRCTMVPVIEFDNEG